MTESVSTLEVISSTLENGIEHLPKIPQDVIQDYSLLSRYQQWINEDADYFELETWEYELARHITLKGLNVAGLISTRIAELERENPNRDNPKLTSEWRRLSHTLLALDALLGLEAV